MDICKANIALGQEVHDFMVNVPDVNEESVTDFLIWRWRQLDSRFKYLSAKTFTKYQEHRLTGADFELELWLVGRKKAIPLLFQAKKFIKSFDSYVRKFNYPGNSQSQLATLQNYAASRSLLPFYAIYSTNAGGAKALCAGRRLQSNAGVFMLPASDAKAFGDTKFGKRLGLQTILNKSNPFHCIFCCPLTRSGKYFSHYFDTELDVIARDSEELPPYVQALLHSENPSDRESWPEECSRIKAIGVYDLREEE
ncbi:DUF6615 family protein [Halomonas sp. BMC7]|nr:DUF6615 family protein [Halomonas sp. BMC7]MDI4637517.1 hypothetical protein [Halomonas sp. BMC7]NUJ61350.1 hypothetical protein [Halomonas taeanensis]